jgi:hypothetical protein
MPDSEAQTMPPPGSDAAARPGPALSATSDYPSAVEAADEAEGAPDEQPVDTKAKAGKDAAIGGDDIQPDEAADSPKESDEGKAKTPPWQLARMAKAENARKLAEQRANQAETERAQALEALARVTGKPEAEKADPRPSRDQFDHPDAFEQALEDWSGRKAAAKAVAEDRAERERGEQASKAKALTDSWQDRKAGFMVDHPDYADVAEADDLTISIPMAAAILEAEDGPALAYYLGQNPETAERISKLSPSQAVIELGRISARLVTKTETPRKPNPIRPLGSRNASAPSADDQSMEAYAASRLPQVNRAWETRLKAN